MSGLFKQRDWQPDIVPELKGSYSDIRISLFRMPCRVDKASGNRSFSYPDFGFEFMEELHHQLVNPEKIHHDTAFSGFRTVSIKLRDLAAIEVEVSGVISANTRQFYSDVADALIDAFESQGISP